MYAPTPKCRDTDYIDFLIASPRAFCCTEAAKVQPESPDAPAHDAFTRLLHRLEPDPATLWDEARPMVHPKSGLLVLDDSTLDKHYAKKIELVSRHWSGKHERVVWGINLIGLVWTDGDTVIPRDYRVYDKAKDGLTRNDHFLAMLKQAKARGFEPSCVAFDSWYSGPENLKAVRARLDLPDPVEGQPQGGPRPPGLPGRRRGGDRPRGDDRSPGGVRVDPGLQGGLPGRRR